MFTCDYQDLINPQKKTKEEAQPFIGNVSIEGVEVDTKRSFREAYASTPEPPIPVWITYHWIVFRAKSPTARITVSDWDPAEQDNGDIRPGANVQLPGTRTVPRVTGKADRPHAQWLDRAELECDTDEARGSERLP